LTPGAGVRDVRRIGIAGGNAERLADTFIAADRLASRSRLDTSPLEFVLDDIESYLKREHGKRRPTDDCG
jgi:hypothetical protein